MAARSVFAIPITILFFVSTVSRCPAQSLTDELRRIDRLRNGLRTPLDEVDRRGEHLLNKYPDPKDQGQIHYQLAHVHAQSGLLHPEKIIFYANEAMQCPLSPPQQMRLYTYWGDAVSVLNRKKPFADRRREAVAVYLKGLRRLIDLNLHLPEKPPETELMYMFHGPDAEENRRKGEEQLARRKQIDFQREMIKYRDVLQGQIVSLYGRRPLATEELRSTATSILGEGKELDRLMTAVNDKIAKLPPGDATANPFEQSSPTEPADLGWRYALFALPLLAILGAMLLVRRWRRSQPAAVAKARPNGPKPPSSV